MKAATATLLTACTMAAANAADPPEPTRAIPLESCYATFGGSGCKYLSSGGTEPLGQVLEQLTRNHRGGASNVVLARGRDIAEAIKAARWTFTAPVRADEPVPPDPTADPRAAGGPLPLWLVAYFGTGPSTPAPWKVTGAEMRGRTARLTFVRRTIKIATGDSNPYFVWVPLGTAEAGDYSVELFDADRKVVALERRVAVAGP